MRELYAAEVRARTATNARATELVDDWLAKHSDGDRSAVVTRDGVSDTSAIVRLE